MVLRRLLSFSGKRTRNLMDKIVLQLNVLSVVTHQGPLKAKRIAQLLSVEGMPVTRRDVNRVLHGNKTLFTQNERFEWKKVHNEH
jgi:hypothetical protein